MVDWLIAYSTTIKCVIPYDKKLGIISWSHVDEKYPDCNDHACATAKYGYQVWRGLDDNNFVYAPHTQTLGDLFASDGDLEMLETLEAVSVKNPRQPRLSSPEAMVNAAKSGHLRVLQWLFKRFPRDLDEAVLEIAAEGGHIHILEWALQQNLPKYDFAGCGDGAARFGHLDILRWLKSVDLVMWDDSPFPYRYPLDRAIDGGHFSVACFLHEGCGMPVQGVGCSLGRCPDVKTATYALAKCGTQPLDQEVIIHVAATSSPSLEMVKFYVLERGYWSEQALWRVLYRKPGMHLAFFQFIYSHAHARATNERTAINDQLDFGGITVLRFLQDARFEAAKWLAEVVSEAGMGLLTTDHEPEMATIEDLARTPAVNEVLLPCLDHRRKECCGLEWLPEWAIRANCFEAFVALVDMRHPHISTSATYHHIFLYSCDSRFLLKLLTMDPLACPPEARHIVVWAAKIGAVAVLDAVFTHIPDEKRAKYLSFVNERASERGYVDVLEWATLQTHTDRARLAVRQGQVTVLEWLHNRQLLSTNSKIVEAMALDAVRYEQLGCLRWLLETLNVPDATIRSIERECVRLQRKEAVRLLSRYRCV